MPPAAKRLKTERVLEHRALSVPDILTSVLRFVHDPRAFAAAAWPCAVAVGELGADVVDMCPVKVRSKQVPTRAVPLALQRLRYYLSMGVVAPHPGAWRGSASIAPGATPRPWPFGLPPGPLPSPPRGPHRYELRTGPAGEDLEWRERVATSAWESLDKADPRARALWCAASPFMLATFAFSAKAQGTFPGIGALVVGKCLVALLLDTTPSDIPSEWCELVAVVRESGAPATGPGWTAGRSTEHGRFVRLEPVGPTCAVLIDGNAGSRCDGSCVVAVVSWTEVGGLRVTHPSPPKRALPRSAWRHPPLDADPAALPIYVL